MTADRRYEQRETEAAAREAAQLGGSVGERALDPAERPVREAGGGYAEGFEEAEYALIEHASHGDQMPAHAILHDRGPVEERNGRRADGEADHVRGSGDEREAYEAER